MLDLAAVRDVLAGRPAALRCSACGDLLAASLICKLHGATWHAEVPVAGTHGAPTMPPAYARGLGEHLQGIVGELWQAADRATQLEIVEERHKELSAEAIAAALLAAEGLVDGPAIPRVEDPQVVVDRKLGAAQAYALLQAALSVVAEDGPSLATVLARHVAPGLTLPSAVDALSVGIESMLDGGALEPGARVVLLSIHAGACVASGRPDPMADRFTRDWIALAWEADERPGDAKLARLMPPVDLVASVVDPAVLRDAVLQTTDAPAGWMERLQRIAEQAGHPRLIRQTARRLPVLAEAPSEVLEDALAQLVETADDPRAIVEGLRFVLGILVAAGRSEELERLTDHAIELSDKSDRIRALLLTQYGAAAKDTRQPRAFLEKVGEQPQEWEKDLPEGIRHALATERAGALRIAGRAEEAHRLLEPFLDAPLDEEAQWVTELNVAMMLRDAGAADVGLQATEGLLARAGDDEARFLAHQSLARTTTALGRHEEAVGHLRAAIPLAYGRYADQATVMRAALASLLAASGDVSEAMAELDALKLAGPVGQQASLGIADATTVLFERGAELNEEQITDTATLLQEVIDRAQSGGDRTVEASAYRVRARLHELLGDTEGAAADWESVLGLVRDPLALTSLAALRLLAGHPDDARRLLCEVPDALGEEHRGGRDLRVLLRATGRLRVAMRQVSSVMLAGRPLPSDVRLVAELSRDAIGRARAWASSAEAPPSRKALSDGLRDEALMRLAHKTGRLWVLEWWEGFQGVVALLSEITADGNVSLRALPEMPVFAPDVAEEIFARLQGWWPTRDGDPLEHDGWVALTGWLREAMQGASPGDHLVVIEHEKLAGLPWHSVAPAAWTTSYAPSWSALLDMPAGRAIDGNVAMVSVPARGETAATIDAFRTDTEAAAQELRRRGVPVQAVEGVAATASAIRELLGQSDMAIVHCHGIVDPEQLELALLVASDGQLPTRHPIAAASESGRAHRLAWGDLQSLPSGPAVLLSAACSSGRGMVAGLGERLGLFAALRPHTRTVIAPAWDALATDVVPQLAEVRAMLLDGVPAAKAVATVGDRAAQHLPAWRARALTLEGDWR